MHSAGDRKWTPKRCEHTEEWLYINYQLDVMIIIYS